MLYFVTISLTKEENQPYPRYDFCELVEAPTPEEAIEKVWGYATTVFPDGEEKLYEVLNDWHGESTAEIAPEDMYCLAVNAPQLPLKHFSP